MRSLQRALALGIAGAVVYVGAHHEAPWLMWLLCGVLAAACARWENLWLAAVPLALTTGDLYPWTGRLWVTERDLLLLSVFVALLWTKPCWQFPALRRHWLWLPYVVVAGVAFVQGMLTLPFTAIGDSLSLYTTSGNTLVIGKALLFGLAFAPYLRQCGRSQPSWQAFSLGMQLSALAVALVVVAERMVTVGLFDFSEPLRVSGPFSSMHLGDQHIDVFWGLAIPFVFQFRTERSLSTLAVWLLQVLSVFAIFSTMSRALIAFALVSIVCLLVLRFALNGPVPRASTREDSRRLLMTQSKLRWRGASVLLGALLVGGSAVGLWRGGDAVRGRFASSSPDWTIRVEHWSEVYRLVAKSAWPRQLMGHGLGSYPSFFRGAQQLAEHPILLDGQNQSVELVANQELFMEQWISSEFELPVTVRARVEAVSRGQPALEQASYLNVHLCSKILLHSFDCETGRMDPTAAGQLLSEVQMGAANGLVSDGPWLRRYCPLTLGFSAVGADGGSVVISEISVTDARGSSLIENGDFSRGSQRWFFTSDDHLVWRAKNMWLHQLVEMGWLGVVALCLPIVGTLAGLLRCVWHDRDWQAAVLFWSLLGFLAIGLFGTLIDVPWILTSFIILLVYAHRGHEPVTT